MSNSSGMIGRRYLPSKIVTVVLMVSTAVGYQNCGGFTPAKEVSSEGMSGGLDSTTPIVYSAPVITIINPPVELTNSRDHSLKFSFALDDRLSLQTATCELDSGAPQDCSSSTFSMTALTDGDHVLVVKAEDSQGQRAPEVRLLFRVDATAPVVKFSQMPPMVSGSSVTVGFTATDNMSGVAGIECSSEGAAFAACTSPLNMTSLQQGSHAVKIRAKDLAGNLGAEVSASWTVDTSAPVITFSSKPNTVTNSKAATFAFSGAIGNQPIGAFQCSMDGASFAACASPQAFMNLADGLHVFRVQGRDNNGAYSSPTSYSWNVDTVSPSAPTLASNVGANTKMTTASISFSATDLASGIVSYQCSLDGASFTACTSPRALMALAEGTHALRAKAIDGAGNDSAVATYSWRVDLSPPTVTITSMPSSVTTETVADFAFTATDVSGVEKVECQLDTVNYAACTSPRKLTGLTEGMHAFRVRVSDTASNQQVAQYTWKIDPLPPPSPADGKLLYANNCAGCHGPLASSTKIGKSAAQIASAIAGVGSMSSLSILTSAEVAAIASALAITSPGATLENPFVCAANSDPSPSSLRRLTKREYTNTLSDLLAGVVSLAQIQSELGFLQGETIGTQLSDELFDTHKPVPTSLQLVSAYAKISAKVADLAAASTATMNAVSGDACISVATVTDACARSFISNFGRKVYRRPLTTAEVDVYHNLYKSGATSSEKFALVVDAFLQAPEFLFLIENQGTPRSGRTDLYQLTPYEIASRLSYTFLGSMPDAGLFAAAADGSLSTKAGIQTQVTRLIGTARAREHVRAFYSQWLRANAVPQVMASSAFADGLDPSGFMTEARQEISDFMDHVIWTQKGNYVDLLTSNVVVAKGPNLARVYGVTASPNPQTTTDPNRKGLFTRAGLLSMGPTENSRPVLRGVRMRMHVLCDHLEPPPNNVMDASPVDYLSSTRSQITAKTASTACMGCHGGVNPLGFAFENYDAFGRFRTQETVTYNGQTRTHAIDVRVSPAIVSANESSIDGAVALETELTKSSKGAACLAKQWVEFQSARKIEMGDACKLAPMYDALSKPGGSILEMLTSVTATDAFSLKKLQP